jgi:hypothetical protein
VFTKRAEDDLIRIADLRSRSRETGRDSHVTVTNDPCPVPCRGEAGAAGRIELPSARVRAVFLLALTGCSSILGISDPRPATDGDGGVDGMVDSNIDAPPPCTAAITLKAELTSDIGAAGTGFAIGRFDNGLNEDIAVATGTSVVILHGDRTGVFGGDGLKPTIPTAAVDLVVDDFDADADDDFVMWNATAVIARRQNRANNPPVEAEQPLTGPFTNVKRVINEQLDGNLRADVLVYDAAAGSRVYTSNGTPGTFSPNNNLVGTGADELVLIKQLDAAQRADALFTSGTEVKLSLQTNAGGFQALSTITSMASSKGVAVGQFDGDALLDIMVSTAQGLVLFRQVAAAPGTFQMQGVVSPLQSPAPMLVADINNDGRDDLILSNVAILQCAPATSGGPGIFTQVETINAAAPAKLVDISGDGKPDLVRIEGTNVKVRLQ